MHLMFHEFISLVHSVKTPHRWTWPWLCLCCVSLYRFLLWTALSTSAVAIVMLPCCPGALGQRHHGVVSVGAGFTVRVPWLANSKPKLLFSAQASFFSTFFFFLNSEGQSFSKKLTQENRRGIRGGQKSIQGTTYESSLWAVIVNCELWAAHYASHGKLSRLQYQRYMFGGFLNRPPSPFLRQNLSLKLELIISARLAMQCAMVTFALPPRLGL